MDRLSVKHVDVSDHRETFHDFLLDLFPDVRVNIMIIVPGRKSEPT